MNQPNIKGGLTVLVFLMFLLLAFWCINMYRHHDSGNWTKPQKTADIIGLVILICAFAAIVIPMLK